ncbi:response regulator [Bradyrhizobium guangdongense]|uniref:DNA-binding response regulator n=1 Tax=Bradyrhizobium guangdongense TaxID=1325090 RepID=A0A410UZ72_9BRAD|nr:response regulator transcription factor [Bradyrhizobium guangdongense]QAU36705.1 DNA-binding response regulator [Bradyrhizobium guangdongense]QOZ57757.1 DNA-binding response regulator [Bradyrhizobium guangdongense]GGI28142.1 DNA-binding response regulator [Bradyrhizobium guangdongense]
MRFLIVEDHPLFREALEGALQMVEPAAEILQAISIDDALEQVAAIPDIDLILLDLSMPGTTGLSGIIRVRKTFPRIPVVIVSGHQDPQIISGALSLGVSGYVLKSSSKQTLAQSIGEVLRGSVCVPAAYHGSVRAQRAAGPAEDLLKRLHDLTPQQLRVLDMLKRGLQNKQIAYELKISETTVKVHVSDILRKLNVLSRTKAIVEMSRIDFANLAAESPATRRERAQPEQP